MLWYAQALLSPLERADQGRSSSFMSLILLNANNRSWAAMGALDSMLDLEVILP